ncbi:2'-5' RNA ligase family protein [Wohlfahrtiimonas larvae]|uniref:2'-5' RNA ligase n=1 Tax=Wohlfahrtiimonas larvae TaxID=1157986 RepID=A0ABP9MKR8_9GAMM|nr:2'-5' RNA ligase family protein [Wohlfahrtiimonas larvae]
MFSELLKYPKTYGSLNNDFYAWHKGRSKYAVWVLEFSDDLFLQRYRAAQQHLSSYLIANYVRQPHITLAPCGFLSTEKQHHDDYCLDVIEQDVEKILSLELNAIEVAIRNILISYAIAPGFEVLDLQGDLKRLNDSLAKYDHFEENYDYFPHVTVGLYNDEWPTDVILEALKRFEIEEDITLKLNVIKLVSYVPTISGGQLKDELMINLWDQSVIRCRESL